jgi:hypothetical protein
LGRTARKLKGFAGSRRREDAIAARARAARRAAEGVDVVGAGVAVEVVREPFGLDALLTASITGGTSLAVRERPLT